MPGSNHLLDRIPPGITASAPVVGAIPQVQGDSTIAWGPALADQAAGNVPVVQGDGSVAWAPALGSPAGAIADPTGGATTDTQARTAIGSILSVLRSKGIIDP